MLYGVSMWFPSDQHVNKLRRKAAYLKLENLQKRAGKLISGGYNRKAGTAFNAELHLMPIRHVAQLTAEQAALRTIL